MDLSLAALAEKDLIKVLFSEKPAVVLQVENGSEVCENLKFDGIDAYVIGDVNQERRFTVTNAGVEFSLLIDQLPGYVVQDLLPAGSPPERSAEGLGAFCELQKSGTQL